MDAEYARKEYIRINDDLMSLPQEVKDIELSLVEVRRMEREAKKKVKDLQGVLSGMEMRYQLAVIKVPEKMTVDEKKAWIKVKMMEDPECQSIDKKISDTETAIAQYEYQIEKMEAEKSELQMRNNNAGFSARAFLAQAMTFASFAEMPAMRTNGFEEMAL